jgi:hypothetical protein
MTKRGRPRKQRPPSFPRGIVVSKALWRALKRQAAAEATDVSALLSRLATDYLETTKPDTQGGR